MSNSIKKLESILSTVIDHLWESLIIFWLGVCTLIGIYLFCYLGLSLLVIFFYYPVRILIDIFKSLFF